MAPVDSRWRSQWSRVLMQSIPKRAAGAELRPVSLMLITLLAVAPWSVVVTGFCRADAVTIVVVPLIAKHHVQ